VAATGAARKSATASSSTKLGPHQSCGEGRQGRQALRFCGAGRDRPIRRGRVGFGHGKAREVPEAIRKATESAKRNLTRVALREGPHACITISPGPPRGGAGFICARAAPARHRPSIAGRVRCAGGVRGPLGIQDVGGEVDRPRRTPTNMVRRHLRCAEASGFAAFRVAARPQTSKVSTLQSRRVGGRRRRSSSRN